MKNEFYQCSGQPDTKMILRHELAWTLMIQPHCHDDGQNVGDDNHGTAINTSDCRAY